MEKAAKTKQELTAEIIVLKKRIRKLEQAGAKLRQAEARREAALELLQQERSLYQDMVNAQPAGIYRIRVFHKEKWKKDAWNVLESAPYSIELASERFCEILGITREIFESTPGIVEEMVHPEDKTEFARKNVEANAKLIPFQWEGRLCVGKKIVWVHFESLPRPVASGDVLWTGFLQDITDHKQAELQKEAAIEALRESEEKLRALSENLAGGMIYQIDSGVDGQKRQFTYLSPAISQLHGLNAEDVLRNPSLLYNQIDENHRAAIAEAEAHAYATKSKLDIDLPIRLSSGEIRWRRFVSYPHTNKSGSVIWDGIELDVTDRKQAEFQREAALQALHDSEERFKSIVTTSQEWIWAMDTERRHTFCNPAVEKILGYRPDEIIGRDIINLLHEEDLPGVREMLNRCLAQKTGWPNLVLRWKHKDGTYRYLESNAVPILDSMGNISGFQGSDRDITGRRQAEEALKKSAEKLRKEMRFNNLLFDNSPAFIVAIGFDGKTLLMNRSLLNALEYTAEEIKSTDYLTTFVHEKDRAELASVFDKIEKGSIVVHENRIVSKSGKTSLVEWHGVAVTTNEQEGGFFIGIGNDITERRRAEDALRESQERLSGFMNAATDSFYLLDAKLHFQEINENGLRIIGKKREEVIGHDIREIVPDVVESGRYDKHLEVIRTGEPFSIENHIPHPIFGNLYFILKSFKAGEGLGVIASDITELKRVEEEKRCLAERLQRAEKMEALGTLAGGVAHDLNNVLGVIVGYAELLLNEVAPSSSIRPRLEKIMTGSEKASAIVQDLLTLARRGVPVKQVVNLNMIILDSQKSLELERLSSYHAGVRMKLDLEPDLLNISGSSVHLGKAMFNLVSNAVEAMPGGGDVIIRTANQYLDKPISGYDEIREGDYVILSVSDTGQGIPAADLQRIFEPFYTKKVMGRSGTGLGLAVIWGTVKDHHGYINVQSEEGKGSTFTLYFPVTREEVTSETAAAPVSAYKGKGESVLVVDDVREQRELASEMLTKLNYKVAISASGEDAVAYLQEHQVNLLVLDMIMYPGMDGLDTYREILKIYPQQKAIIVSGFSENQRVDEAHALGAGAYLKKPYILEKLGMAVRKELDRK